MTPSVHLNLISCRDIFQWLAKEEDDMGMAYQERSAIVYLSQEDMETLGIEDDSAVKLSNHIGSVVVCAKTDKSCQQRFGFMPLSLYVNQLSNYDKGELPDFKQIPATAEPTRQSITPVSDLWNLLVK